MSGGLRIPTDFDESERRDVQADLDKELNKYSFTRNNQLFEDSPNKSEMNQFGDFSGSHSHFDNSGSIERGMANLEKSTDFSLRSKSAMAPMSTMSSISSHTESPRRAQSEGGHRSSSFNRFSPLPARKVTTMDVHESESEYSPSKYYQPSRTPHGASRMNPQSMRKVSPRSFKNTATLFNDLGLDQSMQPGNGTVAQAAQSFRLPRDIPDLSTLMASSKKSGHRVIDTIPVSEDNRKLFAALQDLQVTVESLERAQQEAHGQIKKLKEALRRAEDNVKTEQQRADFAESELKRHLSSGGKHVASDEKVKSLEARNATLLNALNTAKKDLENRTLELELAREESAGMDEECNRATQRLASALDNVTKLTTENESLKSKVASLEAQLAGNHGPKAVKPLSVDEKVTNRLRKQTPPAASVTDEPKRAKSPVADLSYSDEGIEVSRSVLNDSEIEEITQEIEETRRRKAETKAQSKKHVVEARQPARKSKVGVQQSARNHRLDETRQRGTQSRQSAPKRKVQKAPTIVEYSEDESFASAEDDEEDELDTILDLSASEDEDEMDALDLVSTAEDEPVKILYRRRPVNHGRGKTGASSSVNANLQKYINKMTSHDMDKCTICSRRAATRQAKEKVRPEEQNRPSTDPNATIRPSQPPLSALESVLAGLEDEFRHLKIKYHGQTDEYNTLDPSLGKKKRKALAQDLRATIEALEGKADQIYSIFDVLEAAKTGVPFEFPATVPSQSQHPAGRNAGGQSTSTRREWIHT